MTKRIFTAEKGWQVVEPEVVGGVATLPTPPSAVFADTDNEPTNYKLPFKKVLNNHIIIKIDKFKYVGRIKVPQGSQGKPTTGTVVAIADGNEDIAVGDKILYSQFAGYLLKFAGLPLLRCIGRDEVLSTLNEDSPDIETEG